MKISDISLADLTSQLARGELRLHLFPFSVQLKSDIADLANDIALMYADFPVCEPDDFIDFHVEVMRERGFRRWIKPMARFFFDGRPSFIPLPVDQAFAMLEWGLNWCVAAHSHQYLIIHAAVIERNGQAVLLPAPPGSGKSTLCAGLVQRGWRLMSDELALYDIESGLVYGMARPVNLKNASIEVIKQFSPEAVFTRLMPNTTKGTVALMRPDSLAAAQVCVPAQPRWIVLPRYQKNAEAVLEPHSQAHTFLLMAEQSFNYELHGQQGFTSIGNLIDQCGCLQFTYSRLDDAVAVFDKLADGQLP